MAKRKYCYRKPKAKSKPSWQSGVAAKLKKYKTSKPCKDCGVVYPACVMDFDHIGKQRKSFTIGTAAYKNTRTWAEILKEIKKCEIVCANCHRIRTYVRKYGPVV